MLLSIVVFISQFLISMPIFLMAPLLGRYDWH
jgi:hypothetical protein